MRFFILSLIAIFSAVAQDQTGRIEGVVLDAATHQPVKKAMVSLDFTGITRSADQNQTTQTASTDFSGAFSFNNLPAGDYRVRVIHQSYPQDRGGVQKTVRVSAGETAGRLTLELIPGGVISGRIVDEDGDPVNGCTVLPHPAGNVNQGVSMMTRPPGARDDGTYRIFNISPGKYVISAQCPISVFQPRPLSGGPDPLPSTAYPMLFYPDASEVKSAQVVELFPGSEKTGVDFEMRPVPVTHIHGTLTAGSADWRGRTDLQIQLMPLEGGRTGAGAHVNPENGTFDLARVFPGSYRLMAASQLVSPDAVNRVGASIRVDVADKPLDISLPLFRAVDLSGTVEIERGSNTTNPLTPSQVNIQLTSDSQFGGPPQPMRVNDDGTFTIKSVLPGEWQIRLFAPAAFLKSAWFGSDDITTRTLDLTSGTVAPLRLLVGTNTATIKGSAPPGQMVFLIPVDNFAFGGRGTQADPNGQFSFQGLPPGKYRLTFGDPGGFATANGEGQEVSVREGETVNVEIKP